MASLAQHFTGLRHHPLLSKRSLSNRRLTAPPARKPPTVVAALVAGTYPMTSAEKERERLRKLFEEAYFRCRNDPFDGLTFTQEEAIEATFRSLSIGNEGKSMEEGDKVKEEEEEEGLQIGDTCKGLVYMVQEDYAYVDIGEKTLALLPLEQACIIQVKDMDEAGIYPGLIEEFVVMGQDRKDGVYSLSLRELQYELAWERCRQLQADDVPVVGKVIGGNTGGVVAIVEGLNGFIPFSQISMKEATIDDLMNMELPLKIVEVDQEQSRLILSNRKAMADSQAQLGIGTVVEGTVESIKPYGAFIDIGGINGLLHVSQISHDRVADISTILQPGDTIKVMILSHDRERGRVSLSTKKLEPTPGDMIRNPELVAQKAEEMAQIFRQRIAQAEAMARADMLRFQPESGLSFSSDGILGSLSADLPDEGADFSG